MPAIRDYSFNTTTVTTGTTIVLPICAYVQNDLLVAILTADDSATGARTWTATGWTQLFEQANTTLYMSVLYKIASASETDITFTCSIQESFNGTLISIRDIDTSMPFNFTICSSNIEANRDGGTITYAGSIIGAAQSFVGDGKNLQRASFYLRKVGAPTGNITAKVYAHSGTYGTSSIPTGAALATSTTVAATALTTGNVLYNFDFLTTNSIILTNATNYVVSIEYGGGDVSNYIEVGHDASTPGHGGNYSTLTGAVWTADANKDAIFYLYTGGFVALSSTATKVTMSQLTTTRDNCLVLYAATKATTVVPSFIDGPVTLLCAKDGTGFSDGSGWGMQRTAGATPNNVKVLSTSTAAVGLHMTFAVNPPSSGATVIPGYCVSDASLYLETIHGTTAYDGNTAFAATATTYFGTTLNTKTLANATASARADVGLNSFHSMGDVGGTTTSGTWYGCTIVFATANKPSLANKNVLVHTKPYLPVDIQTTDAVTLTGTMGVAFGLCSTANTDYKVWHVSGANTPWEVAYRPVVINTGNTTGMIQNTGTLNAASVLALGFFVSGKVVAPNWIFGSAWVLDNCVISGGISAEPLNISDIVRASSTGHERMSAIQQGARQMLLVGSIQIGDGGTNPVYLDLDATAIEFPEQYNKSTRQVYYCSTDNIAGITYYAGASDTIKHRNSVVSSPSKYFWGFHASSSTSAVYNFLGLQVIGAGTVTLKSGITLTSVTFASCSAIAAVGCILNSCTFSGTTGANALTIASVAESDSIDNCIFTNNTRAIKITAIGTYTFDGHVFSGNTYDVENASTGLVTVNNINGSNATSYINTGGGTTVLNNFIILTLTGIKTGSEVRILTHATLTELTGEESNSTGSFAYQYSYVASTYIDIIVHHLDYQFYRLDNYLLSSSNTSLPIQQTGDRQYSNPV